MMTKLQLAYLEDQINSYSDQNGASFITAKAITENLLAMDNTFRLKKIISTSEGDNDIYMIVPKNKEEL